MINAPNGISATGLASTAQPETKLQPAPSSPKADFFNVFNQTESEAVAQKRLDAHSKLEKQKVEASGASPLNSNADFTTFLKMLTTQMKNQDPLNPVEANDFAVQLATFSSVEQQTKTNQLLEKLVEKPSHNKLGEVAGWIGKIARTKAPLWFGSQPIEMEIKPAVGADKAVLKAINEQGVVVHSQEIPAERGLAEWYGVDTAGSKLPDGLYTFRLDSYDINDANGEVLLDSSKVSAYAHIIETRLGEDGVELVFPGDASAKIPEIESLLEGGYYSPPPVDPDASVDPVALTEQDGDPESVVL